jgi:membrane protein implicated in regulation of membrane protease activity
VRTTPAGRFFARVLGFAAGIVLLAGAFVFSLLLFAVLLAVGIVAGIYLWWKTRRLRKVLRESMRQAPRTSDTVHAQVMEGEYTRVHSEPMDEAGRGTAPHDADR